MPPPGPDDLDGDAVGGGRPASSQATSPTPERVGARERSLDDVDHEVVQRARQRSQLVTEALLRQPRTTPTSSPSRRPAPASHDRFARFLSTHRTAAFLSCLSLLVMLAPFAFLFGFVAVQILLLWLFAIALPLLAFSFAVNIARSYFLGDPPPPSPKRFSFDASPRPGHTD
ncbi:Uncharacterized protein PBTT_02768 [Plasmodiophora brassicae]